MSTSATIPPIPLTLRNGLARSQWQRQLREAVHYLRVAMIARITAVHISNTGISVDVQPCTTELVSNGQTLSKQQYPVLPNLPVQMPRGGNCVVTLPLAIGDEGMVVFNDWDTQNWQQNGGITDQFELRRHDLNDGIFIPGVASNPNTVQNYSATSLQVRTLDGQTVIDVSENGVTITAQTVQVNATNATVAAQQTAQVTGQTVDVTGSQRVNISANSNTYVEGRNFLTHTHSGVQSGGGVSGPVV